VSGSESGSSDADLEELSWEARVALQNFSPRTPPGAPAEDKDVRASASAWPGADLAGAGLAVGKDGGREAVEDRLQQRLDAAALEDLLLVRLPV
jgi:hypothetical protein